MNAPTLTPVTATDPAVVAGLAGRVISPADPDYDTARRAWNLAVDQRPALVVQAATADDVSAYDDTIDVLISAAGPGADTALLAVDVRALGGAAGRPDPSGGAVDSVPGKYLSFGVGIPMTPEVGARLHGELTALRAALAPWADECGYMNFRERPTPAEQFFGAETLAELREVSQRWDQSQLLQPNHPVR